MIVFISRLSKPFPWVILLLLLYNPILYTLVTSGWKPELFFNSSLSLLPICTNFFCLLSSSLKFPPSNTYYISILKMTIFTILAIKTTEPDLCHSHQTGVLCPHMCIQYPEWFIWNRFEHAICDLKALHWLLITLKIKWKFHNMT